MSKQIKLKDLYVGQLITRGPHADAQVYTIVEIDHIYIRLAWHEGTHSCEEWSDYADCYVPTIQQIEYSINHNGPLFVLEKEVETE
jgi:hypothetical protein